MPSVAGFLSRWSEIRPAELHAWFQSLDLAPLTKAHLRSLMHKLFDLATRWEYLPLERRNPIEIVKIKNVTRRTKEAVVLSPEQFREVIRRLPAAPQLSASIYVRPSSRIGGLYSLIVHCFVASILNGYRKLRFAKRSLD
jgi:hypothetical protein